MFKTISDNNTNIIKEKYITDLRDAEHELKFTSPAKPIGLSRNSSKHELLLESVISKLKSDAES